MQITGPELVPKDITRKLQNGRIVA